MLLQIFACIHITSHYFCMLSVVYAAEELRTDPSWGSSPELRGKLSLNSFRLPALVQQRSGLPQGEGTAPRHFMIPFLTVSALLVLSACQAGWTAGINETEGNHSVAFWSEVTSNLRVLVLWSSENVSQVSWVQHPPQLSALPSPAVR